MSYHNIRDKFGRFAPAGENKPTVKSGRKKTIKNNKPETKSILNVFLLDDTGSMQGKAQATVDGFNKVLRDSIEADQAAGIVSFWALSKFGGYNRQTWNLGNIEPLVNTVNMGPVLRSKSNSYCPNCSSTAIWDAVIRISGRTEQYLKSLPPNTKVVFTIFTDGEDNDHSYLIDEARLIIQAKQKEGWVINFIGAGDKMFVERISKSAGIFATNTLSYDNTAAGTSRAMNKMSKSRVVYTSAVASNTATTDGFFSND